MEDWQGLRVGLPGHSPYRLQTAGIQFEIEPYVRFEGEVGEQATMFFFDPFGNALEFKAFRNLLLLFAK